MANNHSNLTSLFTDIADAIRSKTGGSDPIIADQFPEAIEGIESGGGSDDGFPIGDGNTHIWVSLPEERTSPALYLSYSGEVIVDWGDGTEHETLNTSPYIQHEYEKGGDYVISIYGSGSITLLPVSSYQQPSSILRDISGDNYISGAYGARVIKMELGANVARLSDGCFVLSSGLTDVVFAENPNFPLATNFSDTFRYCHSLRSCVLPEGITTGISGIFSECYGLTYIKIPKSVTTVYANTFNACCGLKAIDFSGHESVPTLMATNAFTGTSPDCQIRVPAALADEWKAATNWSTYADYIVGV